MDTAFNIPLEILLGLPINIDAKVIKALTNDDVFIIIQSLSERINDIYIILSALNGTYYDGMQKLLSAERLSASNTMQYINLIDRSCTVMQEKLKMLTDQ
jgi:hypothetical protein